MVNNICSVLINSCDKYEDAWYPFFELVKKYWKDCEYPFYLNTESKNYKHDGVSLTVINCTVDGASWGKRLKDCLKSISSKYVILFLEDFFLQREVNQNELDACIRMMEENDKFTAIYFKQIAGFKKNYEGNVRYFLMDENKMYKLNLQAGLWRKKDLEALVADDDTPWEFEFVGQNRLEGKDCLFLCSRAGTHYNYKGAVFPYLTGRTTGYGIWAGKWLWNNNKLFQKNGLTVKDVNLELFTRKDMLKYYMRRIKEKLNRHIGL